MADAYKFPIEAGHILLFARSVGDPNQIYYDAQYAQKTEPGAVIPPPTFLQARAQFEPGYPLRPTIGQPWFGSGKEPTGVSRESQGGGGTGLHAEQHFEYLRPIKAGDVLTVTSKAGNSWTKEGKRGGKLTFSEGIAEFRNQHGELVATARSVGVRTEKVVEG